MSSILNQYITSESNASASTSAATATVHKVGLYTSPHLRFARERIKINDEPLSEEEFAKYFFEVWDRLEQSATAATTGQDTLGERTKPAYFHYLTLMAFHAYMSEGVDAAVIECGIGGEYDCTNIITEPIVSGITSLGVDHVFLLGDTIEEIAWHKGGIIKAGARVFTAPQPESALEVLRKRAEKKTELIVADGHPELNKDDGAFKLGLDGDFQYTNANVAIGVAAEFLRRRGEQSLPVDIYSAPLPERFRTGLAKARLGGRCETRKEKTVSWYIDGGHTLESIRVAGEWFASKVASDVTGKSQVPRVLIFNQQTRDGVTLARALYQTLSEALGTTKPFSHAIFCTNVTYQDAGYRPDLVSVNANASEVENLSRQHKLAEVWNEVDPEAQTLVFATIEEAVDYVRDLSKTALDAPVQTLVTGSLHLVGGFLDVIETKPGETV